MDIKESVRMWLVVGLLLMSSMSVGVVLAEGDLGTTIEEEAMEGNESVGESNEENEIRSAQEIEDWHDLDAVRDDLDNDYVLMKDLDEDTDGYEELVDTEDGWEPIGDHEFSEDMEFTGSFDGNGHEIRDLYIDRPNEEYIGLFGAIEDGAEITDLGVVEADVEGDSRVGALVGSNEDSTVSDSYATGNVNGEAWLGGLVGFNLGTVSNSYAAGDVDGERRIGGLVGRNSGTVTNSYAIGEVGGEGWHIGGLVGRNTGEVSDSYAVGEVSGNWEVGGLVGMNEEGTVTGSYAVGEVSGASDLGGLVGTNEEGTVERSFYHEDMPECDVEGFGSLSLSDDEFGSISTFESAGWDIAMINSDRDKPFLSWEEDGGSSTWYIKETQQTYDLTIDTEGEGSTEPSEGIHTYYEYGKIVINAISGDDWYFEGWTGDYEGPEKEITITMDEDKGLTAHFYEPSEWYGLTADVEGEGSIEVDGEEVEIPYEEEYEEGTEVNLIAVPTEGWGFVEWAGTDHTEEEINVTMDSDKNITAVFEVETYTLDVDLEGEGEVEIDPEQPDYEYGTEVNLTAVPADGFEFDGWTGDHEDTESEITITMDSDKEITAIFEEEDEIGTYELLVDVEGQGHTNPPEGTYTYSAGEEVTVEAIPDEGWYFVEWTGDHESEDEEVTIIMDSDKEITAIFEEEDEIGTYELLVDVEGQGHTNPPEGTHTYSAGEKVTVEAIPDEGWYFVEWTGDHESVDREITVTMDADKTLTAHFAEPEEDEYVLTINRDGGGTTEPGPGDHIYQEGEQVAVEAIPDEGWYFVEWTGDYTGTEEEITLTMDEDKEITAHFDGDETFFEVGIIDFDEVVEIGENITIEYQVENTGAIEDTQEIELRTRGVHVERVDVTLAGGEKYIGEFMFEACNMRFGDGGEFDFIVVTEDGEDSVSIVVEDTSDHTDGPTDTADEESFFADYWWLLLIVSVFIGCGALLALLSSGDESDDVEQRDQDHQRSIQQRSPQESPVEEKSDRPPPPPPEE